MASSKKVFTSLGAKLRDADKNLDNSDDEEELPRQTVEAKSKNIELDQNILDKIQFSDDKLGAEKLWDALLEIVSRHADNEFKDKIASIEQDLGEHKDPRLALHDLYTELKVLTPEPSWAKECIEYIEKKFNPYQAPRESSDHKESVDEQREARGSTLKKAEAKEEIPGIFDLEEQKAQDVFVEFQIDLAKKLSDAKDSNLESYKLLGEIAKDLKENETKEGYRRGKYTINTLLQKVKNYSETGMIDSSFAENFTQKVAAALRANDPSREATHSVTEKDWDEAQVDALRQQSARYTRKS